MLLPIVKIAKKNKIMKKITVTAFYALKTNDLGIAKFVGVIRIPDSDNPEKRLFKAEVPGCFQLSKEKDFKRINELEIEALKIAAKKQPFFSLFLVDENSKIQRNLSLDVSLDVVVKDDETSAEVLLSIGSIVTKVVIGIFPNMTKGEILQFSAHKHPILRAFVEKVKPKVVETEKASVDVFCFGTLWEVKVRLNKNPLFPNQRGPIKIVYAKRGSSTAYVLALAAKEIYWL